jgi:uncharacterized membrane protein YeaQ/YmgE (transglycosylase-associated protein family)
MSIILTIIIVIGVIWLLTKAAGLVIGVIIAGLVGWAASSIMGGDGAGVLGNVLLGMVGGLVGPIILSLVNINPDSIILGGILSSLLGAIVVIAIARVLGFKGFAR